ncbi:MAG: T9SS type A sorting domain-containing protein [Sphingobacteriales bacterium JAD_PAG50586_3]|nr:MAG: T9SS type A sorting domain-containing protein [Sphingobacteriales bacterium JAD_PAG50586_3]
MSIVLPAALSAQLSVNTNVNANLLARTIVNNSSIKVENTFFIGCPAGMGTFTATNTNLGLTSGIILASGNAIDAIGPNSSEGMSSNSCNNGLAAGDADLDAILQPHSQTSMDVTAIEFDFSSTTPTTLTLTYVFGSEEYPSFLNFTYSDLVGMFLTSPGQEKQNIALVPGTTDPVGVDWISPITNTEYYIDNGDGSTPQGTIQYNGFTVPLTAQVVMEPNVTYHLKIVVADAGDYGWDAGVFIGGIIPVATSTIETAAKAFNMYPNPANEFAMLNYDGVNKGVVQIFDALGRIVYSSTLSNQQGNIQLETGSFASGLYSVRILDNNVSVWNGKLVVE